MDWDVLIIFDACRFDCFEEQYERYLKGNLIKVRSEGVNTKQWMTYTWKGWYDVIYVSAMPYINGMGIPFAKWRATDHFKEIIDVWNWGFDEEIGWIPPDSVNETMLEVYDPDEKYIIHYVQPHKPYIGRTNIYTLRNVHSLRDKMLGVTDNPIVKWDTGSKAKNRVESHQLLYAAYKETLDLVLEKASEIIEWMQGKIIITADHGELMGEDGRWGGHLRGPRCPALLHVPWLEVEK